MSLYRDIKAAIKALWSTNWPHGSTYTVLWHENANPQVPDIADTTHWLHISVSFGVDTIRAFGGGRHANERVHIGTIDVRVFTAMGAGESSTLDLLSDALAAFRSQRSGNLSFLGDLFATDEGGTEDGAWWMRSATLAFEYRFTG